MFYRNEIKSKKTSSEDFSYDMLSSEQKTFEDDSVLKYKEPKIVYNFITGDGTLKSGYGFKDLSMPDDREKLDEEKVVSIRGNEIRAIWKLKWFDSIMTETDKYYLFYFNDENIVCYDNILDKRYTTIIIQTNYTEVPYATYYRSDYEDALLLSGENGELMLVRGGGTETTQNAPKILSCCTHYGKLFAITDGKRGTLAYANDTDVLNWTDEGTQDLDFGDGRGNLNKIISFDDYIYLFRDFGITRVSIYGKDEEFSISHMYFSDSFIYPDSIAQSGDNIYFLTASGLKVFNGSTVRDIVLDSLNVIKNCDNKNCFATCFNGKYFLACRGDFNDGLTIGCEGYEDGFINNLLFVYDIDKKHVEILRGVDIHQVLALTNPYKSKLIACFNNQHIGRMGELTQDGKIFEQSLSSSITFAKSDFGKPNVKKRIKSFLIKSEENCQVTISNEEKSYTFSINGKDKIQKIRTNIVGESFSVKIDSVVENAKISKFVLTIGQEK